MIIILIFTMIFCHIIDDYVLQDALCRLKQKKFWREEVKKDNQWNALEDTIYKNDYKIALFCHAFEWSFMINLPLLLLVYSKTGLTIRFVIFYTISMILNTIIHSIVDNAKANEKLINLVTDQIIHFIQVILTALIFCVINGWKWI